jgi:hypothetical protein
MATTQFGFTSIGSNTAVTNLFNHQCYIHATRTYTAASGDTLTQFAVYGNGTVGSCEVGLYVISGGVPTTRVGSTSIITFTTTAGWATATVSIALTAGVTYGMAIHYSYGDGWTIRYQGGPGGNQLSNGANATLPSTWSQTGTDTGVVSFYATATSSGGGTSYALTSTGTGASTGTLAVAALRTLTATGTGASTGSLAVARSITVTATGTGTTAGSLAVSGLPTDLTGTGTGTTAGSLAVAASSVIAATGTGASTGSLAATITSGPASLALASTGHGTTTGHLAVIRAGPGGGGGGGTSTSGRAPGGYQPRNTPAERRAFFDHKRQLAKLQARIEALEP